MGMKRGYKGQEGYFFKSGNKKLRPDLAIINFAKKTKEGGDSIYLGLLITKENGSGTVLQVKNPYDVLDILCELGVNKPCEVEDLPEEKRRVVMYSHDDSNYGFCFANKMRCSPINSIDRHYSSVVGEFHKLGNLEDRGFFLPEVTSYDSEQSSISVKEYPRRRRKLGEIIDGKVYVGKPSAACLAAAKAWKYMPGVPGQIKKFPQGFIK